MKLVNVNNSEETLDELKGHVKVIYSYKDSTNTLGWNSFSLSSEYEDDIDLFNGLTSHVDEPFPLGCEVLCEFVVLHLGAGKFYHLEK